MIVISFTSCIGANGNGGNVRGASVIAWVAAAACGGGPRGLAPDTAPAQPLVAHADGHLDGAALGWTLGSAVHLFVADSAFTRQIYDSLIRPRLGAKAPGSPASALAPRGILTLRADHISRPAATPRDTAGRRLRAGLARTAVHRTAPHGAPSEPLVAPLAADPDAEADAGDVQRLSEGSYAAALRARVVTGPGDTALVSGVALLDGDGQPRRWLLGPTRTPLRGGFMRGPVGRPAAPRYVLRGVAAFPPERGALLLVDAVFDVSPRGSRSIVVDPRSTRVVATQPLALHCP